MPRPGDRRPLIADCAISVLAHGGARALTHQAVDRAAGIAPGSTSYYFRTRRNLVIAAVQRIRNHSRAAFDDASQSPPGTATAETAAVLMESQLLTLAGDRRDQALAVFALLPEVENDTELRLVLARCLFSLELAQDLLRVLGSANPANDALDLIDFLTGLLFGMLFGQRRDSDDGTARVGPSIERFLRTCR